ncbi:MAG: YadA-like family protein, partial [Limnothrix sp.]
NAANIATSSVKITSNMMDIATNSANIATNSANIATNTADIAENRVLIEQAFDEIEENSSGVAMALALSSLTKGLAPGKRYGVGVAFGTFKNQQSIAVSGTFAFTDPNSPGPQVIFNTGIGLGLNKDTFGAAAGLSIQW